MNGRGRGQVNLSTVTGFRSVDNPPYFYDKLKMDGSWR
jgi:hypothetical protein